MLEIPVASAPQLILFELNFLLKTIQNFTAVLSVNSLTLRDDITVHNPMNVTEIPQHVLDYVSRVTRLLLSWRLWAL